MREKGDWCPQPNQAAPSGRGDQGIQGLKGDTGLKGDKGETGAKGDPGPGVITTLETITLTQTAIVAIALGPRIVTTTYSSAEVGANYELFPVSVPAGYSVGNAWCETAGTMKTVVYAPLLAIGASYSITCKVRKIL